MKLLRFLLGALLLCGAIFLGFLGADFILLVVLAAIIFLGITFGIGILQVLGEMIKDVWAPDEDPEPDATVVHDEAFAGMDPEAERHINVEPAKMHAVHPDGRKEFAQEIYYDFMLLGTIQLEQRNGLTRKVRFEPNRLPLGHALSSMPLTLKEIFVQLEEQAMQQGFDAAHASEADADQVFRAIHAEFLEGVKESEADA